MLNRLRRQGSSVRPGSRHLAAACDRLLKRFGGRLPAKGTAPNIVVLGDAGVAARIAEKQPGRTVHLVCAQPPGGGDLPAAVRVQAADGLEAIHEALKLVPRIGLVVDALPPRPEQATRLRQLLYHVWPGGLYAVLETAAPTAALLDALDAVRREPGFKPNEESSIKKVGAIAESDPEGRVATRRLAGAVAERTADAGLTVLQKRGLHLLKVREEAMTPQFVDARMRSWTDEQVVVPGRRMPSRSTLVTNRPDLVAGYFPQEFDVPPLVLRTYDEVICAQRQMVSRANLLLPDTFRLIRRPYLKHDILQDVDARFAKIPGGVRDLPRLAGAYYYLDSEYPATYGHLLTDMIGRLWAWDRVRATVPGVKLLVSTRKMDDGVLPAWLRATLNAYGIPDESIEVLDGTKIVERLYSVTPQYVNFTYAAPEIRLVWDALRDRLLAAAGDAPTPSKVFVARAPGGSRECRNAAEVEALFADAGYAVVRPEQHGLAEQAALFARAERIAGYGGSGMLNTIFSSGPRRLLVLQPDTHAAVNEYLISSVLGDDVTYVYSRAELTAAAGVSARDRYQSPYTVDLAADGPMLREFAAA